MPYNSSRRRTGSPSRMGAASFRPAHRRSSNKANGAQYINPTRFTNAAIPAAEEIAYQPTNRFVDFDLGDALQRNIATKGYVTPSAIQDQAIGHVLDGRDVIGLANTGTGKTAAFLLPILARLDKGGKKPSVLIMAPTRELAIQIDEEFRSFATGMQLYSTVVVGGANIERQVRELSRRPHIVIATPGRLKDLLNRGAVKLDNVTTLVLDEADRMLDMGFLPDIRRIVQQTPDNRQTLFFSATITKDIEHVIHDFLRDPVTVSVRKGETNDHIEQSVIEAKDKNHKVELLTDLLGQAAYDKVLVFGDTKFGVQRLSETLTRSGIPATAIHGNKTQSQRQRALKDFRNEHVRVLVATDVAARGLDIPNVSHVINFDQPKTYEDYVHRIGRTGRAGASGTAHTFVIK
ncbi:MAG TPA: DEAD/DEAH box helicase [Candidatus Saccharimonadales bacterium]|jgi:superfamily II DNA/RNA helicase